MKYFCQFLIGGSAYYLVELIFRYIVKHRSPHWTMFILGGLSLVTILLIENKLKINIIYKSILGGLFITIIEFMVGFFYKYVMNDMLWCYGGINFLNIISLKWSLLWCLISFAIILFSRLLKIN